MRPPSPAVRQYCEQHGFSRFVRERGFDYLLRNWKRIVGHVSEGYRGLFVEFLNDMDTRRIIQELLPLADDVERAEVQATITDLDAHFLKATRPINSCIWGESFCAEYHCDNPQQDWWYYRIPSNLNRVSDPEEWPSAAA